MYSVLEWFVLVLWCDAFSLIVLSDEPVQNKERGLVVCKIVKAPDPPPPSPPAPSNFIACRLKAALLYCYI